MDLDEFHRTHATVDFPAAPSITRTCERSPGTYPAVHIAFVVGDFRPWAQEPRDAIVVTYQWSGGPRGLGTK